MHNKKDQIKIENGIQKVIGQTQQDINQGITLISLVITIIVLLILAGVTISTLTGNNGILTQAQEAKKQTQGASLKEQLTLEMANYEIAKTQGKVENLSDYLQNQSTLQGISIVSEETDQLIGYYQNRLFFIDPQGNVQISKSENLISNGLLENKDNTNFPNLTYQSEGYLSTGDIKGYSYYESDDYIPVDIAKKYYYTLTAKSDNVNSKCYIGFQEYDRDFKRIQPQHFMYVKDSLTYLERDLKKGDTEVYLNDVSGFKTESNIPDYQKGFIFWNYRDSTGYQYPELTYSRNVYKSSDYLNIFNVEGVDRLNNKITLNEPWQYDEVVKGTKLSQTSDGAGFNYSLRSYDSIATNWETYARKIEGINDGGKAQNFNQFRPGTKYIRFAMMINYAQPDEITTVDLKNFLVTEIE